MKFAWQSSFLTDIQQQLTFLVKYLEVTKNRIDHIEIPVTVQRNTFRAGKRAWHITNLPLTPDVFTVSIKHPDGEIHGIGDIHIIHFINGNICRPVERLRKTGCRKLTLKNIILAEDKNLVSQSISNQFIAIALYRNACRATQIAFTVQFMQKSAVRTKLENCGKLCISNVKIVVTVKDNTNRTAKFLLSGLKNILHFFGGKIVFMDYADRRVGYVYQAISVCRNTLWRIKIDEFVFVPRYVVKNFFYDSDEDASITSCGPRITCCILILAISGDCGHTALRR